MQFDPVIRQDKWGREIVLRHAQASDAAALVTFMQQTARESRFLLREPGEFQMTADQEARFIESRIEDERALLLVATVNGEIVGLSSAAPLAALQRYAHRCELAIALYQTHWGAGIGKLMLSSVLDAAKNMGYEQAELDVVSTNTRAIRLYESVGFEAHGTFPHCMKYADGTYADTLFMVKRL